MKGDRCKKAREKDRKKSARESKQEKRQGDKEEREREREQYLIVLYNILCYVPGSNCFRSFKGVFSVVKAPGISQP